MAGAAAESATPRVERWGLYEASFHGPDAGTPYVDAQFAADFRFEHRSVAAAEPADRRGLGLGLGRRRSSAAPRISHRAPRWEGA